MKVIDLFCGAGGISEGFRQAGFDIVAGYDKLPDAQHTFKRNFPSATVAGELVSGGWKDLKGDDIDIIVGGPPCQEFSSSNKWGNGDVRRGLIHVQMFFEYIESLKPRFYLMENVPRLKRFLFEAIEDGLLELPKGYDSPSMVVLDAQHFGVPQRRKRLFTSNLNLSQLRMIKESPVTLGDVVSSIKSKRKEIIDINNKAWNPIHWKEITHHWNLRDYVCLNSIQSKRCEDLKVNHGFAGRMAFPDKLDEPSRTIMATQTFSSRETMVIKEKSCTSKYRSLTIRENASIQGFPLSYQFEASSVSSAYQLVGNAVPIGLARHIANAILEEAGEETYDVPIQRDYDVPVSIEINPKTRSSSRMGRWFYWHPSGSRIGPCRVDLDNRPETASRPMDNPKDDCKWSAVLHVGIGKERHQSTIPTTRQIWDSIEAIGLEEEKEEELLRRVQSIHGQFPDSSTLLRSHMNPDPSNWRMAMGIIRPRYLLDIIDSLCDGIGDDSENVDCSEFVTISPKNGLPIPTLVRLFALHWACIEINYCSGSETKASDGLTAGEQVSSRKHRRKNRGCVGVKSIEFPRDFSTR